MSHKSKFAIAKINSCCKKVNKSFVNPSEVKYLYKELVIYTRKKLEIKINDNHTTMLSVKWEADRTRVSLHRIFLDAPKNVMEELACYIGRKNIQIAPAIRAFIETNIQKLDYSNQVDREKLITRGSIYNLEELYQRVNEEYFQSKLQLAITWFGNANRRNRSRITFGLYQDQLKLIKIHKMLDSVKIPKYFINFIIYHEMLHCVSPSYYDKNGVHHIHSKEFKALEKLHSDYDKAQEWIQENRTRLFHP